jgi:hypothetical protein
MMGTPPEISSAAPPVGKGVMPFVDRDADMMRPFDNFGQRLLFQQVSQQVSQQQVSHLADAEMMGRQRSSLMAAGQFEDALEDSLLLSPHPSKMTYAQQPSPRNYLPMFKLSEPPTSKNVSATPSSEDVRDSYASASSLLETIKVVKGEKVKNGDVRCNDVLYGSRSKLNHHAG